MFPLLPVGTSFHANRLFRNALAGAVGMLSLACELPAAANEPRIVFVEMERRGGTWTVHVTVRHDDTGWDHYADAWHLLDTKGNVLGTRTLYHPHETEQPFTRSLSGVAIPPAVNAIDVQAHDKVHGWGEMVRIPLRSGEGERSRVH